MNYKKCPECDLNYIPDNEELCETCKLLQGAITNSGRIIVDPIPHGPKPPKVLMIDFSHILSGRVYGTNTRKIYEKFCDTLGWDKSKANQFGWQTPLYATNADTDRTRDVWFICYPNYAPEMLDCIVEDRHVVNLIQNNGDTIIEVVVEEIGKSNNADRITFVKTKYGYEFFGVYKLVKNSTTRVYQRISKDYPIKL